MQFCLWGEGTVKAQPQDRPKPFVAKPLQTRAIGMLENVDDEDDGDDDVQHDEHDLVVSAGSELQTSCFAAGHFPTRSPKLMTTRVQRMLHAEQATCALIRWHLA